MDTSKLSHGDRQIRMNIRNFFLVATVEEMRRAMPTYRDAFSRACIQELIDEAPCLVCEHMGCGPGSNASHTYNKNCLCKPE
jgi:hypothetical protein